MVKILPKEDLRVLKEYHLDEKPFNILPDPKQCAFKKQLSEH
jgi:hypothetical protein